jgi:hypothetical protein
MIARGVLEVQQPRNGARVSPHSRAERSHMFVLIAVLIATALAAAVGSIVLVSRDGYGRVAERKHVRIY